jgi:hypothetical protein
MPSEDNWFIRSIKGKVAAWSARTETARQMGDDRLLRKALKYKTRYEKELAKFQQLEAESEQRQETELKVKNEGACQWCTLFKELPECIGDDALIQSSEFILEAFASMGITLADLEKMEENYAVGLKESSFCDECRAQHDKNLAMLTLMRQTAQEKSKET